LRSQGIPRLINAICDNLLLTAFAMESKQAELEMLEEVTSDLRLEWPGRRISRSPERYRTSCANPPCEPARLPEAYNGR